MGMTLDEVLARFREEAQGNLAAMGAAFEALVKNILLRAPVYRGRFRHVWHWNELGWGHDVGIDLVAEDVFGKLYGIQAKCYAQGHAVSKPDVDTFLATLGKAVPFRGAPRAFDHGMVFASTDAWGPHAEAALVGWAIPVQLITRAEMDGWAVDWAVLAGLADGPLVRPRPLRDYQEAARDAAHAHFAAHDRGQLIMACGTGKTLTALRILENECPQGGLALFLVPSIALLNQTLIAWSEDAARPLRAVCVCSDAKAHRRSGGDDAPDANPNSLALPPTTDATAIAARIRALRAAHPGDLTVVFSTYQSIGAVGQAQRELGREAFAFDFALCDEAHRTTGLTGLRNPDGSPAKDPAFIYVHDDNRVLIRRRLYMTATPRLYAPAAKAKAKEASIQICSMDDPALYGEVFYRIGFGQAVKDGWLADYKVLVLTLPEDSLPEGDSPYDALTDAERKALESRNDDGRTTAVKLLGCINALAKRLTDSPLLTAADGVPARRAVAFCRTIATSRATTALFRRFADDPRFNAPLRVDARHVDGAMGALDRGNALSWLKAGAGDGCRLLTNVRCLSEGVDVPSLDAVLFLSRRNSQIDVVQSVGRVMRKAPGKRYGYIVIPVVVPAGKSPEAVLDDSDTFGVVWTVLNALRAHDERFEATINKLRFDRTQPKTIDPTAPIPGDEGPIIDAPGDDEPPAITISTGLDDEDGAPSGGENLVQGEFDLRIPEKLEQYRHLLYGRIVEKCGDRAYFERWAADVAAIAARQTAALRARCEADPRAADAFRRFHALLQTAVYAAVSEGDARVMLVQQRLTGPIFDALFGANGFTAHNPVSHALDSAADLLDALDTEDDRKTLKNFYEDVRTRVGDIRSADGKLEIIRTLYDTFFSAAFPGIAEKLGIVFTPIEAVDFILRSADDALRAHFGRRLSDRGVHILDPFTGTGTFIARLLQKDLALIRDADLYRKYAAELHANEIVLLSYYIAAVNIENVFHDRAGRKERYAPFPGIVLADTFRMRQVKPGDLLDDGAFAENSERILAQNNAPISVIVGNPPYVVAKGEAYPALDKRVEETYVANSAATNKNSLYDSYIKAFRWASDIIENPRGGILCFISNGGWLDTGAGAGVRKCIVQEFDEIYCYNLRGNQNTQGEISRREGGKIFGSGCRCPISILLLVRLPDGQHRGNAAIHYRDVGDYKTREEKLHDLILYRSFLSKEWLDGAQTLTPDAHGDWLNQRNDTFAAYIPLTPEKKFDAQSHAFFVLLSSGLKTARDPWCYAFSAEEVKAHLQASINLYEHSLKEGHPIKDPHIINWNRSLLQHFARGRHEPLLEPRIALYRPFCKMAQYFSPMWNDMIYQIPKLFPTGERGENVVICVSGDSALIADVTPDLHFVGDCQCFPLYWYEERDVDLFGQRTLVRHDGVSDWILDQARRRYGAEVTKEEIFYYVYGFLHQPGYRKAFAADLKKSLPRIPLAGRAEDFRRISDIGRRLAALHLGYEALKPYPLEEVGDFSDTRIVKMRLVGKGGKDRASLVVNGTLTLRGIPEEAFRYQVNGRSPLDWAVDRYQVRTDKASGIVNDPNLWAPGNPRYIPDLLKRLVTLSVETLNLIDALPPFAP